MNFISNLAFSFLLTLATGVFAFTPIASTVLTGAGFHKLVTTLCASCLLIAFVIQISSGAASSIYIQGIFAASLIFFVINYLYHRDHKSLLMWAIFLLQNILHLYLLRKFLATDTINFFYVLSSCGLLSIITYAMVLGHWYLVVPKLSEKPLILALRFFWVILFAKCILTSVVIYRHWNFFSSDTMLGAGYTFNWLMLLMRVVWGYVVTGAMSYFTWRLVKMRDIQGATGILYAMTFFMIVGELCALYMFYQYGLKL